MNPHAADDVERLGNQLVVFAREMNAVITSERLRRREAEDALTALQNSYLDMVRTLAFVVEAQDKTTRHHLDRTYGYARALAARVAPELLAEPTIGYGFLLHDIGKVGIPDDILKKPGPLTDDEWAIMRTHPLIGVQVVSAMPFLGDAVHVIRSHHERWDGRGYPEGLKGEEIHVAARIFSVVDSFDAIVSARPYKPALPVEFAMEQIELGRGGQFDPDLAAAFLALLEEHHFATLTQTAAIGL